MWTGLLVCAAVLGAGSCCEDDSELLLSVDLADGRNCFNSGIMTVSIEVADTSGAISDALVVNCRDAISAAPLRVGTIPHELHRIQVSALSPEGGLLYSAQSLAKGPCAEPLLVQMTLDRDGP